MVRLWNGLVSGTFAVALVTTAPGTARAQGKAGRIQGYVLDSACAFIRNVKKPLQAGKCARECAQAGSPLAILGDDGTIYCPISDAMPATGQNPRLIEFAGERVTVEGKVFERGGAHAIVIEKIEVESKRK